MPIQDHVTISEEYEHVTEVFGYRRMAFSVVFHNLEEVEDLESFMEEALKYIIDERFEAMALEDRLALEIHHPGLNSPINWPFLPHYKEMKTLSATNSGMFDQYINAFLKSKQEASGWPSDVHTDEDKARYIAAYEEREGVKLDVARIALNPGLRQLSKLCLNSFWGKFGQRANMPRTELIKKPERLFELLTRNGVVVHKLDMVNDIVLRIQFTEEDEFVQVSPRTSCIIAAWVTAQARLKLYSFLEPLADRVLYMDTDSVVYLDRPEDAYKVPLGNFLGEMTDELPGTHIREWVSSGPKQYGYRTASGKTTIKVRGITLDSTIAQTINFEAMKKLVITLFDEPNEEDDVVVVHRRQIGRFPDHTVVTKPTQKTFRYVYDKCHVRNDFVCVPYGYCG